MKLLWFQLQHLGETSCMAECWDDSLFPIKSYRLLRHNINITIIQLDGEPFTNRFAPQVPLEV